MKNISLKLKLLFLGIIFSAIFGLTKNASATSYYIDKDSIGGTCNNSNAGTLITAPWCTIAKANTTLTAGDTAYLRAGSYAEQILPANNGTVGNPITHAKHASETVNITYSSDNPQANLSGRSYITIDGLNFLNASGNWVNLDNGGNHCIIQNGYFSGASTFAGISMANSANYNKILNNTMTAANGTMTYASQVYPNAEWIYSSAAYAEDASYCPADLIYIDNSSYNLVQGNTLLNAQHVAVESQNGGDRNIVRGNDVSNHWHTGVNFYTQSSTARSLVESNIIHDCGSTASTEQPYYVTRERFRRDHAGLQSGSGAYNQIVRKNVFYGNGTSTITAYGAEYVTKYAKWYNNTMGGDVHDLYINCTYECSGIVIKNNSLTSSALTTDITNSTFSDNGWLNYFTKNNIYATSNKYKTSYGTAASMATDYPSEWSANLNADPLYTNAITHDYTLQASSPNINAGDWLTTITSASGSGTSFTIADASYFFDGWGISGEVGDTIQLQGQSGTAVITNVDYLTNTITVNNSLTWTQGLGVALAYSGSAPDIGAYEYQTAGDTTPPTAPSGLSVE